MNQIKNDKNKKINGFTFIEIIVSISILSIISIGGVIYFQDFVNKQYIETNIENLNNTINVLDNQVKSQKIFDYNLFLGKGSYGYHYSLNNIGSEYIQESSFDSVNGNGNIELETAIDEIWEVKIYQNNKKSEHFTKNGAESISVNIPQNTRIESNVGGGAINTLYYKYFDTSINNGIQIIDILDENIGSIYGLKIENKNGKKIFSDNNNVELNIPIYIIFEKNGIQSRLEINN